MFHLFVTYLHLTNKWNILPSMRHNTHTQRILDLVRQGQKIFDHPAVG